MKYVPWHGRAKKTKIGYCLIVFSSTCSIEGIVWIPFQEVQQFKFATLKIPAHLKKLFYLPVHNINLVLRV